MERHIKVALTGLVLFLAACSSGDKTDGKSGSLGLDEDNNGICDSNEGKAAPSTEMFCMGSDPRCPVPHLSKVECTAACTNALALIAGDKECFPRFNFGPFSDMAMCETQCTGWGACNPTYVYCFKDAKTCAEARQCRIDKAL